VLNAIRKMADQADVWSLVVSEILCFLRAKVGELCDKQSKLNIFRPTPMLHTFNVLC
jgi:hypothetical protein